MPMKRDDNKTAEWRSQYWRTEPVTDGALFFKGASGTSADRALRGFRPADCLRNYRSSAPLQSLAHEPGAVFTGRILVCRPPLAWISVKPGSGARHRTDPCKNQAHQGVPPSSSNTLNVSRAVLGNSDPVRMNRERLSPKGSSWLQPA
jgi:hypothetical protein